MISKDMQLMDLLQKYPEASRVFEEHGMGCIECLGLSTETIETGAKMHSINLKELLKDLNRLLVVKNGPS